MQSSNNVYLNRIDILRFIAATLVLFWHYIHFANIVPFNFVPVFFPLSILTEGHTGVSLFMVLSGFIFQYINAGKEIVYARFLRNRFFRIFPLAIFWILALVAIDHLDSAKALLNTFFVFDSRSVPGVGWTIVVEFQFYLIFPVFHKVIERKGGIINILGLIMLMIIIRSMLFINVSGFRDFCYYSIFGRLDLFLAGMIGARLYVHGKTATFFQKADYAKIRLLLLAIVVSGLLLFFRMYNIAGGLVGSESTPLKTAGWIIFNDVEALFYVPIILLYLSLNISPLVKPIETVFAKFGEYSYSMYWLHFTVLKALVVILYRFPTLGLTPFNYKLSTGFFIALPLVTLLSGFSYNFFEKPFLQYRQKYSS